MPARNMMQKILVSACLLGEPVRYDGKSLPQQHPLLRQWLEEKRLVSFCPEVAGGLPTPRVAAEITRGDGYDVLQQRAQVIERSGQDVSAAFIKGAKLALDICQQQNITIAILSARSPSCGNQQIYDGSFSGQLKKGSGVTAALLKQHGISVFNQHSIDEIADYLTIKIAPLTKDQFSEFFPEFKKIIAAQQSYALDPEMDLEQAFDYWCQKSEQSFALTFNKKIAGIYYLKPNGAGPASHICNCGYMVSSQFNGKGLARLLCQHSQQLARDLGYHAMQFNMVLSSNLAAVHLWKSMGFERIGTIPQAYQHNTLGMVDGYIMYKRLIPANNLQDVNITAVTV